MEIIETKIKGLLEIIPNVFGDERGYFFESYQVRELNRAGIIQEFVQDNQSYSTKGVLRGLHFQKEPFAQAKLVRVISGKVLDIAVDLRKDSSTFGEYYGCILDDKRHNMLYIPPGFAHGFATLEDAIFVYKCSDYYNKDAESGIKWNDETLQIDWMLKDPVISAKDQQWMSFKEYQLQGE